MDKITWSTRWWLEGRDAYSKWADNGGKKPTNPYALDSKEGKEWKKGFLETMRDMEERDRTGRRWL